MFRLGDIAKVTRGYVDPPQQKMRWQGKEALGLGVTMVKGGDVIELGHELDRETARLAQALPVGVELAQVASMPRAVQRSINQFLRSLTEAVLIVLAVSLVSLGLRTGLVVAVSIPLVLAVTFLFMWLFDIGLHKISLGALILSLGLLVDDAIIAVEMMAIKLEQGYDRFRAASFAYTSTAFPMLTGTLVTVAGFLPIATAKSGTGEYTRSIFQVSAIALIASWVIAVVVIPYLGYKMLPDRTTAHEPSLVRKLWARLTRRPLPAAAPLAHAAPDAVYQTPFYNALRRVIAWCVGHRTTILVGTLVLFVGAVALFRFVPQQFFPASSRVELLVDLRLPEGSSFAASLAATKRLEAILDQDAGHRKLRRLRRQRVAPLLPAARPAAAAGQFRAGGADREEHRGARDRSARGCSRSSTPIFPSCAAGSRDWRTGRRSASRCSSACRGRTWRRCGRSRSRWRRSCAPMPTRRRCSSTGTSRPR